MTTEMSLATNVPRLTKGQLALYELFYKATEDERIIKKQELFEIYKRVAEGKSYDWTYKGDQKVWYWRPWDDWQWNLNFFSWFTYNLGALLKKGCLRVVPAIDLSVLKNRQKQLQFETKN